MENSIKIREEIEHNEHLKWNEDEDADCTIESNRLYIKDEKELRNELSTDTHHLTAIDFEKCKLKLSSCKDLFFEQKHLKSIYNIDMLNMENSTDFSFMLGDCKSLKLFDAIGIDTSNATDFSFMFGGCTSFTSLDLSSFNTSKVTDMNDMFWGCMKLTSINLSNFNTSNVTNMHLMFAQCYELHSLDISSFDFSNIKNIDFMFDYCNKLTDLKFGKNLRKSLEFVHCPLSHESALSVIDGLGEPIADEIHYRYKIRNNIINFSQVTYETLTDEDKKRIEAKGWRLISDKHYDSHEDLFK